MQARPRRSAISSRPENVNVTSAVGMEDTVGRQRAKRNALFAQTVIWMSGLICGAFLLGTLAQAYSNNLLVQQVQTAQRSLQQVRTQHTQLQHAADYYKDPSVIESEARQQLDYVHPAEQAVVMISSNDQRPAASSQAKHASRAQGYWQDWWQLFFAH